MYHRRNNPQPSEDVTRVIQDRATTMVEDQQLGTLTGIEYKRAGREALNLLRYHPYLNQHHTKRFNRKWSEYQRLREFNKAIEDKSFRKEAVSLLQEIYNNAKPYEEHILELTNPMERLKAQIQKISDGSYIVALNFSSINEIMNCIGERTDTTSLKDNVRDLDTKIKDLGSKMGIQQSVR